MLLSRVPKEARREATEEERRTEGFCEFIFVDAASGLVEGRTGVLGLREFVALICSELRLLMFALEDAMVAVTGILTSCDFFGGVNEGSLGDICY